MSDEKKKEIDDVSGVETTGHEWDGLKELNNPSPRWWIWVWIACTVWAVGYWVFYPTWPTLAGNTKGILGWTSHNQLVAAQDKLSARQDVYLERFEGASLKEIMADPELYAFAVAGGNAAFKDNCATCHGSGGVGGKGFPNLNDDDWLWGGLLRIFSRRSLTVFAAGMMRRVSLKCRLSGRTSCWRRMKFRPLLIMFFLSLAVRKRNLMLRGKRFLRITVRLVMAKMQKADVISGRRI